MQNLSWFSYLTPIVMLSACQDADAAVDSFSHLEEEEEELERCSHDVVAEDERSFLLEGLILDELKNERSTDSVR